MTSMQNVQRATTHAFIMDDPTDIVLTPQVRTITEAGGRARADGPDRPMQTFKLIPMTFDQRPTITAGGVERIIDYTLLGEWDAVMEIWDYWIGPDGARYTIMATTDGHGYETKGLVERHIPED